MKDDAEKVSYRASYSGAVETSRVNDPDIYSAIIRKDVKRPKPQFVISRNNRGEVVSLYRDMSWSLEPYKQAGNAFSTIIHFSKLPTYCIDDAKWLLFVLIFMVDTGRATGLGISTIMSYLKPIRSMAAFAKKKGVGLLEVLSREDYLKEHIKALNTRSALKGLISLTSNLHGVGKERTGFDVINIYQIDGLKRKTKQMGKDEQYPVIPPRLYSELISQLSHFVDSVNEHKDDLNKLLNEILKCNQYARSRSQQFVLGYRSNNFKPFFKEAVNQHGLDILFTKYKVNNLPNLTLFITRVQHACKLMIYIYSGMRSGEALSLKVGCLDEELLQGRRIFKIHGETTKLVGQKVAVTWITSEQVKSSIELAEMFAKIIGVFIGVKLAETPLFITSNYLGFSTSIKKHDRVTVSRTGAKSQEVYQYLDEREFKIKQEDLDHLKKVNDFRAWENERQYKLGAVWRFSAHQFRRSLAFYVSQSALVTLPSLKKQLKHISREMTVYYCQATTAGALFNNNMSNLFNKVKPEADAFAFLNDVIKSEESLWGAHGRFIDKHMDDEYRINVLADDRVALVKRFKSGEISYKATPLGACTTIEPCDKKAAREISACLSCDKAIVKLSKLDTIIYRQSVLVEKIEALDGYSLECRTEKAELASLKKYRDKIILKEAGL